jgi:agmatinase
VRWYDIGEISRRGLAECLEEAAGRMQGLSGVYLSFDIDVVDPGMAPGTGTPEPGGLTSRQALDAVRICAMKLPLVGMELVEVSPPYDSPGAITAFLANRIVLEALSGIAWRRQRSAHE